MSLSTFDKPCQKIIILSDVWARNWDPKNQSKLLKRFKNNKAKFNQFSKELWMVWLINKNIHVNIVLNGKKSINVLLNEHLKRLFEPKEQGGITTIYSPVDLNDDSKDLIKYVGDLDKKWLKCCNIKLTNNYMLQFFNTVKHLIDSKLNIDRAPYRVWCLPELEHVNKSHQTFNYGFIKHFKSHGINLTNAEIMVIHLNRLCKVCTIINAKDLRHIGLKDSYAKVFQKMNIAFKH